MKLTKTVKRPASLETAIKVVALVLIVTEIMSPSLALAQVSGNYFASTAKMAYSSIDSTVFSLPTDPTSQSPAVSASAPTQTNQSQPDRVVNGTITVYTSTPDQTDDSPFIAASGKHVYDGMIAANGLPFGTKIKIPDLYGDKIFTVEDRMNARYSYGHFDIWLDTSKAEAMKFGRKHLPVEIYLPETAVAVAQ